MTSNRIHEMFKTFGKLLNLDRNFGEPYASGVRAAVTAIEHQNAAAANAADPYGELQTFIGPVLNSVRSVISGLDRVPTIAKQGVDAYIRIVGAAELSQPTSTPPATILSALITSMNAASDTVSPSGVFFNYFLTTYGVQLPQHSPPTIADSLITTVIV
jgi:hypothetical protein